MKVSVILCVYNEEKFVKKAIDSILYQTLDDFEFIIVNDGSTDNTLDIIKSYDDKRIKLINQDNIGLGASRNKAMAEASGEYVVFLDGDDWFSEDALEIAYGEAKSRDTDISMFKIKYYDDETGSISGNDWFDLNSFDESFDNRVFSPIECKDFLFDLSVNACQKIYKNTFLKESDVKFVEGIYFEDMPFFFEIFLKARKISIIRKHLYYHRKHANSITDIIDCNYLDTVPAGQELMKRFIDNGFYEDYKYDLIAYKINGPKFALSEIVDKCKKPLFDLIHDDYLEIRDSIYYDDFLNELGPVKRKFFLDIIKSNTYDEFEMLKY
ncbi:glycosyltransferase [uncultured Methanobrevibacter sp.]|uniref:glycosyltransferase family 2 protein n=1 Tax=uncultured Methanobrevibacter sp. TaxID=253161 RepID=UPI0025DD6FAD|nr:glycosyltransferase [uncultured Methanobrevibacter sp.]